MLSVFVVVVVVLATFCFPPPPTVWLSSNEGRSWQWQESTASFGVRQGAASVISGGNWLLLGGVSKGVARGDVYIASLPAGNPSADGGVLGGILGMALGVLVFVFLIQRCLDSWREKQRVKRMQAHHAIPQDAFAVDAGQGKEMHLHLPEQPPEHGGGGGH